MTGTIAIGDVHGNLRALEDLLAKVLPVLSASDNLVFLGDYIDKGPDIRACIDCIIRTKKESPCPVVTLLGNHEQAMLRTWNDPTSHSWLWMRGFQTIESYSAEAAAILEKEIECAGPRLIMEKVSLPYHEFVNRMPPVPD